VRIADLLVAAHALNQLPLDEDRSPGAQRLIRDATIPLAIGLKNRLQPSEC
jgi:hypothetical protein